MVGAGAGLSAAAGLAYDGERFERLFADFREAYGFTDMYTGGFYPYETPEAYWAWWSRHILANRYDVAAGEPYLALLRLLRDKDYFVLTTNVDHQFRLAGFPKARLFYTQGDYGLWQCAAPCHDGTYDNEAAVRAMAASQRGLRVPAALLPRCPVCGGPMTMNLRCDERFVQDEGWYAAAGRCEAFLRCLRGRRVLFLELGVGANTPAVIKFPFWRMTAANPDAVYYGGNYPEGSLLLKQIRDKGITSIYVGSSGVDTSELVNIAGKENAAGAYYISSSPAFDSSAVLQEWVDRYQQTSGLAADGYAIYFYEAAAVALESLSNAIDAAGGKPTRAQVVEAMANVEITSITGTFQFDEKGDNINAKAYAYEIVDGYPGKLVGELTGA